jgi:hypothetical protein
VGPIRVRIEGFLRGSYGYEGDRAFWVLSGLVLTGAILLVVLYVTGPLLCVAVLLALLLALRIRRGRAR